MTDATGPSGPIDHFWAVVPAGGAGTRLWPLSRAMAPKFLLDLTGSGRTLIQGTLDRLGPLTAERVMVVTGAAHRDAVAAQLPDLDVDSIVAEPSARDSMAAIGLAAAMLERRDPDAVMGSFAADHVITESGVFRETVRLAVEVARDDWLVTIGIDPISPSPAFGYVHLGRELDEHPGASRVRAFVEKPSVHMAREYLASGQYRWNAGMFVVRPTVLLDLLAESDATFAATLRDIAKDPSRLEELWPTLPRIAVDHAVAEPAADAGRVAVVPASFGWDDVGDFDSLAELLGATSDRAFPVVLGEEDQVRVVHGTGLVVPGSGRMVAVIGIDDVVVVDTPDALLVTTRGRAQEVKRIVAALKETGRTDLT